MRPNFARAAAVWIGLALLGTCRVGSAQTAKQPSQSKQSTQYGQTIFSRGATTPATTAPSSAQPVKPHPVLVSNAERTALTYLSYNLEVHLDAVKQSLAVEARMTARNTGSKPLDRIALQLSSALHWYSIHVDGNAEKFQTEPVESDIDHTGQLTEAVVELARPLAPGATIQLDVLYSGAIEPSSERLLRLGAPRDIAATSDWDRITPEFTALRGFGNVIWFPVSTAPVLLGEGAQMFDSVGKWKLRESGALVQMHVLADYTGTRPTMAFLNGYAVPPDTQPAEKSPPIGANSVPSVASFTLPPTTLGFAPLSFFVVAAASQHFSGLDIYPRAGNAAAAPAYATIVENDRPLAEQWLGARPKRPVILVDLPESGDLPYEERNILFLPLQPHVTSDAAGPMMAQMLAHAYFISPRPWLNEGVAQLMALLWIEQRARRTTAIGQMESTRAALALAETNDPGVDPGQSLIHAWSDIYYRDKAVDVLWMLREMTGDTVFAQALRGYAPDQDKQPDYFQNLLDKASQKDMNWFFDDWVYHDRGLPDLHIASAYRRPLRTKNSAMQNYLVSVEVRNDSFCSAEVPVTVESESSNQTGRLLVPSHGSASLRMLVDGMPSRVLVNDGSVPEVRTSHHEKSIVPAQ